MSDFVVTMAPFGVHIAVSDQFMAFGKVVLGVINTMYNIAWYFSYSVSYMVTSVLYDQFRFRRGR